MPAMPLAAAQMTQELVSDSTVSFPIAFYKEPQDRDTGDKEERRWVHHGDVQPVPR
jgi:hypothetical protein